MAKNSPEHNEWQERIQAWQASGLSQNAWCKQHDIRVSKFGYWKRKLEKTSRSLTENSARSEDGRKLRMKIRFCEDCALQARKILWPEMVIAVKLWSAAVYRVLRGRR
ncbi:IS66 family insertion sequence element accessory protein TnpA [Endozoicomonas sp. ALB032]|uniref:IS66 family insertion sequence element accessory protein TnpA n=1 Tax=Endozoicomonas sp. ALB032 TaxID=3403082 RepID=UPI003BB53698